LPLGSGDFLWHLRASDNDCRTIPDTISNASSGDGDAGEGTVSSRWRMDWNEPAFNLWNPITPWRDTILQMKSGMLM